jgi:adenosylcobinamide kinase/adenosylcobinamide-phosphate guanylyltransferase
MWEETALLKREMLKRKKPKQEMLKSEMPKPESTIVLITGGARSGKSGFAELLARERGRTPVVYVATAEPGDAEMAARIARHRAERPADWITVEIPLDLVAGLETLPDEAALLLVDCLALWTSNRLLAAGEPEGDGWTARVEALEMELTAELTACVAWARRTGRDMILVTNEVGQGLVPMNALGRAFRDLLGRLNQHVAREANAVFLVTAGQAIELKRQARIAAAWAREVWSE